MADGTPMGGAPSSIGPYPVTGKVGAGGFGTVYLGTDPAIGDRVAIKVLGWPDEDGRRALFRQEVAALLAVDHPNVVRVRAVIDEPGLAAIITDYVEGASLRQVLRASRTLDGPQTLSVLGGALRGLAAVHAAGLVHADLKPANILLDTTGTSRLIDFGLTGPPRTLAGPDTWIGTPAYLAPEVVLGQHIDARSDLYGVSAVLFELLTGRPPFVDPDPFRTAMLQVHSPVPDLLFHRPDADPLLAALCSQDLAKAPEHRHQNAAAFLTSLGHAAGALAPQAQQDAAASLARLVALTLAPAGALAAGAAIPGAVGLLGAAPLTGHLFTQAMTVLGSALTGIAGTGGGAVVGSIGGAGAMGAGSASAVGASGAASVTGGSVAAAGGGAAGAGVGGAGIGGASGGGVIAAVGGAKGAAAIVAAVTVVAGGGAATVVATQHHDQPADRVNHSQIRDVDFANHTWQYRDVAVRLTDGTARQTSPGQMTGAYELAGAMQYLDIDDDGDLDAAGRIHVEYLDANATGDAVYIWLWDDDAGKAVQLPWAVGEGSRCGDAVGDVTVADDVLLVEQRWRDPDDPGACADTPTVRQVKQVAVDHGYPVLRNGIGGWAGDCRQPPDGDAYSVDDGVYVPGDTPYGTGPPYTFAAGPGEDAPTLDASALRIFVPMVTFGYLTGEDAASGWSGGYELVYVEPRQRGEYGDGPVCAWVKPGSDDAPQPALTQEDAASLLIPAGACGSGEDNGWNQTRAIQLVDGVGERFDDPDDPTLGGASIRATTLLGTVDLAGDSTPEAVVMLNCSGSPDALCCAGRASILNTVVVLDVSGAAPTLVGGPIWGGTGRQIDEARLDGEQIVTVETYVYDDDIARHGSAPIEVTHAYAGGRWS